MSFRIRIEGTNLRFSAAHFATFGGDCEPLHGHNYAVTAEMAGDLSADSWVLDFGEAKRTLAGLCSELDHKLLLQMDSRELSISESEGGFDVRFGDRRYAVPAADVACLPIDNSTAERLAEWLAGRLRQELGESPGLRLRSITVGVEEAPGQSAWFAVEI